MTVVQLMCVYVFMYTLCVWWCTLVVGLTASSSRDMSTMSTMDASSTTSTSHVSGFVCQSHKITERMRG